MIKSENFQQISNSETEHMESSRPSGNKDDGKSFIHKKEEVRVKSKEKKMQRVQRLKDLNRPKKKTKFEEFLEMDTPTVISGDQDAELERRLAKKLKVKKGKLRGLDDGLNDLFEGLPSVLDSMESELGDSRKKRKKKRSEEKHDHEDVDKLANEDLEREESDFSEEPAGKRDRYKKKNSVDEDLESDPMNITDDGESETVTYHDSPSSLEKVESPLHEHKTESSSKYVAPHLRSQAKSESEELTKMRTRIKGIANKSFLSFVCFLFCNLSLICLVCVTGLLNKMAESNVETITAELASIYRVSSNILRIV